ncbi:MAG TPA: hypothetical protein VFA58_04595 [Chthoniobacterales bacterium]|nr:hypothetical protein [Chthoniobacterales bacterium]
MVDPLQDMEARGRPPSAQQFRQNRGLIKTALTLAGGMQRYGNNHVEMAMTEPFVVHRGQEPACDEVAEMKLFSVLKVQDYVPNDSAGAVTRDRRLEVKLAMRAIGAGERSCNGTVKWL